MNQNTQFERDLEQWLQTVAPASAPAGFHASVMDRARTLRQRPGWATSLAARRFGRGRGMTVLAAATLLLVGGALAAASGALRLLTVVPPVPAPSVIADASPGPIESAAPSANPIPVAGPGGIWIPTGSMVTPRSDHTAVRLQDGRVLVVGGGNSDENDTSAEIYSPDSGTWSAAGNMIRRRSGFPPTLLRDGSVVVGDDDGDERQGAELFDPVSRTWSATGKPVNRGGSTATLLRDGQVLVIGYDDTGELYEPVSGTWSATGKMTTPRHSHTALLLPDGKVLVAGGHAPGDEPTDAAELYDPDTGAWTAIANMHAKRDAIGAFVLPNGKALVVGSSRGEPWSAELYDPATGTWTARTALPRQAGYQTATLLSDGTVLVAGIAIRPEPDSPQVLCTAPALYDPRTGSSTTASSMLECENGSSFTLLLDGTVLVAGGSACNGDGVCVANGTAELYVPAGVSAPPLPAFPLPPPPVFPSPTPVPTPLPPAAGPVPPNARSWTVTVDNRSSEPATLFVAEEGEGGMLRLVGSATPAVVPAGATVKVTFLFPADGGWIYVNPRPGEGGALVNAADIGIPGKILITPEGDGGWLSP